MAHTAKQALIIVESPAKCKTMARYLGSQYTILATFGHVEALSKKKGSVDPDRDFQMVTLYTERGEKAMQPIEAAIKKADILYLATDPDREGEAIASSVQELLKKKKLLKSHVTVHRLIFNEFTKAAILKALDNPLSLNQDLVDAQYARRALDYLVGYSICPLLWKKVRYGLSAGRVQSPALRLIVEREEAIQAFQTQEYWTLSAPYQPIPNLLASLSVYQHQPVEKYTFVSQSMVENAMACINHDNHGILTVHDITRQAKHRRAPPPLMTATLQQMAVKKLGFSVKRAMSLAQQLYEQGHITYMRTDSVTLSNSSIAEIREVIHERYGASYVPKTPNKHHKASKNAQEAHEAIRPTHSNIMPDQLSVTHDQRKLYTLIWQRAVASQMLSAHLETTTIVLATHSGAHHFKVTGTVVIHAGFQALLGSSEDCILPPVNLGDAWPTLALIPKQHFTEPPARYTEASLIKALEGFGIGRPSTYAGIIDTILKRHYVTLEQQKFYPTDVGLAVNQFLKQFFEQYIDYHFTARLEDDLDAIARGESPWKQVLRAFWTPFSEKLNTLQDVSPDKHTLDENCPECQQPLMMRLGKYSQFIGCSNYPECSFSRALKPEAAPILLEQLCQECQSPLQERFGRYGKFVSCSRYPTCQFMPSKPTLSIMCPDCQKPLMARQSRFKKVFYGCSGYPSCRYAIQHMPIAKSCPLCHFPFTMIKTTKRIGQQRLCPQKDCSFSDIIAAS
jgi:DNA topoisomerase I